MESGEARRYSVGEVALVLGVACLVVLLFDAQGLREWASGLELGPQRQVALGIVRPVAEAQRSLGLHHPRAEARRWFLSAIYPERTEGWDTESLQSPVVAEAPDLVVEPEPPPAQGESQVVGPPPPPAPKRVLLIGDSLMGWGLGTTLERRIDDHPGMEAKRHAVVSSGLSRPDFFDWFALASDLLGEAEYDAVVGIMGGNDVQAISAEGKIYRHGTDEWRDAYARRARSFLALLSAKADQAYWLGLPPMRGSRFHEDTRGINAMFEAGCALRSNAHYVELAPWIGDEDGGYTSYLEFHGRRRQVRASDGIHFTTAGGQLLAERVYEMLVEDLDPPG